VDVVESSLKTGAKRPHSAKDSCNHTTIWFLPQSHLGFGSRSELRLDKTLDLSSALLSLFSSATVLSCDHPCGHGCLNVTGQHLETRGARVVGKFLGFT
jgi:hypothetical protein